MEDEPTVPLPEAARRLGVHYMTAYRHVRTGRLAAHFDGLTWHVPVSALTGPSERPSRNTSTTRRRNELRQRMLAGDESGAWWVLEDALTSGLSSRTALMELVSPALAEIGDGWARGEYSVADEHCASAVATRLVARLGPTLRPRGRSRGAVIIGSVEGDRHGLVVAIAADVLRGAGVDVIELGADVPTESFIEVGRSTSRLSAVAMSATQDAAAPAMARCAKVVRDELNVPVIVGGGASGHAGLDDEPGIVRTSTCEELVEAVRRVSGVS